MLYNELISYNQTNVTYNGTLILNVLGLNSPVIVNNATVLFSTVEDTSNFTTMGIISYDVDPYGIMTLEVTQDQADAILEANFIVIETSAEVQMAQDQSGAVVEANFTVTETSAEVHVINTSTSGTLLIP